jgi:uncharacterized protein (TIGR03000 family)
MIMLMSIFGISSLLLFQTPQQPPDQPLAPFVSSIDAPNTYGAYTQGPGFMYLRLPEYDTPEEQKAYVHVRVFPAHAKITFQGSMTRNIGSSRLFVSPPLEPGENYTYEIGVTWDENGRTITQNRKVLVRAGDHLSVVFRESQPPKGTTTLRTQPAGTR